MNAAVEPVAALEPDADALVRVLADLFRYTDEGTFISLRAFDQRDAGRAPVLLEPVEVNGDWRAINARVVAASARAATAGAVFAPPIATFSTAERAGQADLANGVALSVEIDAGDTSAARLLLEHLLGPATMVVASGGEWTDAATGEVHDKLHVHWRLTEPTRTAEDHARLREARWLAAALVGADRTAVPPCHPLRWPGSWHLKGAPKLVEIIGGNPDAELDLGDALEALEEAVEAAGLGTSRERLVNRASGPPQAPVDQVAGALSHVPNGDLAWDEWNQIGMAVWRATGGSVDGYAAWERWSAQSRKHDADNCLARWNHYAKSPPSRIGAGTIFFLAKTNGWQRRHSRPLPANGTEPSGRVPQDSPTPQAGADGTESGSEGEPLDLAGIKAEIDRLSRLDELAYRRERTGAAKAL